MTNKWFLGLETKYTGGFFFFSFMKYFNIVISLRFQNAGTELKKLTLLELYNYIHIYRYAHYFKMFY